MVTTFSVQLHPMEIFPFLLCHVTFSSSNVTARVFQYAPAFSLMFVSSCRVLKRGTSIYYLLKQSGFNFFVNLF